MEERKNIVVVGANGSISKAIIPLLLKNYQVHSVVRSPPEFAINSIYLHFVQGEALKEEVWDQCLQGKDAVVSCFGVRNVEPENNHLEFTNLLIEKMKQKGIKRFIGFFSHGAFNGPDGKKVHEGEGFTNKARGQCHSQCIEALEKSELNYTAICLWKFKEGASELNADEKNWSECPADSEGVASFISKEIENPSFSRKTVFLHNKQ